MSEQLLIDLALPFPPSAIQWRAGATNKDKSSALALAYADPRAYMERLDQVCGLGWGVAFTPWNDKIICNLTVGGVTRSSTGEPDSDSERAELSGTVAEAQAFKRACAMFGLGRYLYSFPSKWVDLANNRLTDKALAQLDKLVSDHYAKVMVAKQQAPNVSRETLGVVSRETLSEVDWPAMAEALAADCKAKAEYFFSLHAGGEGPANEKKYGLLAGTIDNLTEKQHGQVLSILCRRVVTKDNPPSDKLASKLLDALLPMAKGVANPLFRADVVDCIKAIAKL